MKLAQLKYFLAVYRSNNFTVAANEQYVSQPAISRAIRDLEQEFGVRFFKRNNNRLEITEQGEWLAERAKFILSYVDETEQSLHAMSANQGYVRMGVDPMVATAFIFPVVIELAEKYPDTRVDITEAGSVSLRQLAEASLVDFSVCITDGLESSKLQLTPILTSELVYCVGQNHPYAKEGKEEVSIEELSDQKIILFKEDSFQHMFIKEKFAECGSHLKVYMCTDQLNSIVDMLNFGNCGAFLFKEIAESKGLKAIPLKDKINLNIGIVWNSSHRLDEAELRVRNFIASRFNAEELSPEDVLMEDYKDDLSDAE
ncbi:MAG: LysR family transcriptional regulator [Clostridia bacterium]|nr:LysR family transcriptional regulator [Clostridia bacterium]